MPGSTYHADALVPRVGPLVEHGDCNILARSVLRPHLKSKCLVTPVGPRCVVLHSGILLGLAHHYRGVRIAPRLVVEREALGLHNADLEHRPSVLLLMLLQPCRRVEHPRRVQSMARARSPHTERAAGILTALVPGSVWAGRRGGGRLVRRGVRDHPGQYALCARERVDCRRDRLGEG